VQRQDREGEREAGAADGRQSVVEVDEVERLALQQPGEVPPAGDVPGLAGPRVDLEQRHLVSPPPQRLDLVPDEDPPIAV